MSKIAEVMCDSFTGRMVTLNVSVKLYGSVSVIKDYLDIFAESESGKFLDGTPTIQRTLKFEKSVVDKDECHTRHERKVTFRLRVPVEYNGVGGDRHRCSPTSLVGKYIDEFMSSIQLRNCNHGQSYKDIVIEPHELMFAKYKPDTSKPYWKATSQNDAIAQQWIMAEGYSGKIS